MQKFLMGFLLYLFFWLNCNAHEPDLLKTSDISRIMQQILSEHVDKNEMTAKILQSSLRIYIDQFDPHRMYLLESEAAPYFNPSSSEQQRVIDQYKRNDFSPFERLNSVIQASIERSRLLRKKMNFDGSNSKINEEKGESPRSFAKNIQQLEQRIQEVVEEYIDLQKKRYGDAMTPQRKEQILAAYEAKLRESENQYLYQNQEGGSLSAAEKENLFALHVLKALANSLDAHTSFYEANEAFDIRVRLQQEFKGIGIVLKDANEGIIVTHLLERGPAAKSQAIEPGDALVKVDGVPVAGQPFEKTMEMLHGDKNTHIALTFKRGATNQEAGKIYTVDLKREMIVLKKNRVEVTQEAFGSGIIGTIALHPFIKERGSRANRMSRAPLRNWKNRGI